jgi:hypothetical protein
MDISEEPPARALLEHLATTRDDDDPLGSLARSVLSGEASLREAASYSWHQHGLLDALRDGMPQMDDPRAAPPGDGRPG